MVCTASPKPMSKCQPEARGGETNAIEAERRGLRRSGRFGQETTCVTNRFASGSVRQAPYVRTSCPEANNLEASQVCCRGQTQSAVLRVKWLLEPHEHLASHATPGARVPTGSIPRFASRLLYLSLRRSLRLGLWNGRHGAMGAISVDPEPATGSTSSAFIEVQGLLRVLANRRRLPFPEDQGWLPRHPKYTTHVPRLRVSGVPKDGVRSRERVGCRGGRSMHE